MDGLISSFLNFCFSWTTAFSVLVSEQRYLGIRVYSMSVLFFVTQTKSIPNPNTFHKPRAVHLHLQCDAKREIRAPRLVCLIIATLCGRHGFPQNQSTSRTGREVLPTRCNGCHSLISHADTDYLPHQQNSGAPGRRYRRHRTPSSDALPIHLFPAPDHLPYHPLTPSRDTWGAFANFATVSRRTPFCCVAPVAALLRRLPPPIFSHGMGNR